MAYSATADNAATNVLRPVSDQGASSTESTPASPDPASEKDSDTPVAASQSARSADAPLNGLAIAAFLLSAIGLLFPVGLWLGYRTRAQIDRDEPQLGREFATAAIVIGWLWVAFVTLGLLAYLWILI